MKQSLKLLIGDEDSTTEENSVTDSRKASLAGTSSICVNADQLASTLDQRGMIAIGGIRDVVNRSCDIRTDVLFVARKRKERGEKRNRRLRSNLIGVLSNRH